MKTIANLETISSMQRTMKRHKFLDEEQNVDRLSALPDAVICHILSFMPTKLSMKTSILAKRWGFLWAHVPFLDLQGGNGNSQSKNFASIICTLMLRHKVGSLNTFRLNYRNYNDDDVPTSSYVLKTCIATAIERNVHNLDLRLEVELPRCVLTCKTLVDLRIGEGVRIPSSDPIYLPSLKKLYFRPRAYYVHFPRLISGCPVLEELIIDDAPFLDLGVCTLSSPTLKKLAIIFWYYRAKFNYKLMINAPALRYLKVRGYMLDCTPVFPMNSLTKANICFTSEGLCLLKLLDTVCNVKFLKLSCYYKDYRVPIPGLFVKFGSLTKLQFSANWCFLTKFLESADHLQELIIREWYRSSEDWMDPIEERCACLVHSLRIVRIDSFCCTDQGFNMVKFILRNAQVLERMDIYCPLDSQKKFDALQRISSFRRGSKECVLAFS